MAVIEDEEYKLESYDEVEIKLLKRKGYEIYYALFQQTKDENGWQNFTGASIRKDQEIKADIEDSDFRKYAIKLVLENKERLDNNEILKFVVDAGENEENTSETIPLSNGSLSEIGKMIKSEITKNNRHKLDEKEILYWLNYEAEGEE